ncbi:MAG: hypothetical protein ACPGVU_26275 [Limisphaerales bacterium]
MLWTGESFAEIHRGLAAMLGPVLLTHPIHGVIEANLGHLHHTHNPAILLSDEETQMTAALFANPNEPDVDGFTRFVGPGSAGDDVR